MKTTLLICYHMFSFLPHYFSPFFPIFLVFFTIFFIDSPICTNIFHFKMRPTPSSDLRQGRQLTSLTSRLMHPCLFVLTDSSSLGRRTARKQVSGQDHEDGEIEGEGTCAEDGLERSDCLVIKRMFPRTIAILPPTC